MSRTLPARVGTTSPDGWQKTPGPFVADLVKHENRLTFAINWLT